VLGADVRALADAIRVGGLADIKAPRIQHILRSLQAERGELDLSFLGDMSVQDARRYLAGLPGVGPKTAACVLLFSLGKPALPVDTHVHRVVLRLGLAPPKASAERASEILEDILPQDAYYPFHLNIIRHGRTLCKAQRPLCDACALACECRYYAEREATKADAQESAPA